MVMQKGWSISALRFLINNNAFPFFLLSHTNIWVHLYNFAVNKRFHAAVEKAAWTVRRYKHEANSIYFICIFAVSLKIFLRMEACDLEMGGNNAQKAYAQTGLYPFCSCPDTWEEAIDMLG